MNKIWYLKRCGVLHSLKKETEDGVVSISEKHISIIDEKRLKIWAGKEAL